MQTNVNAGTIVIEQSEILSWLWPLTKDHVDLLTKFQLIPVCIVEIDVNKMEILRRATIERCTTNK